MKTMKKNIFFIVLALMIGSTAMAQDKKSESKVQHITYQDFLKKIWDFEKNPNEFVYKGKTAAIVDFYADWCGPCRKVAPILEKLAVEYDGKLTIYKVNTDQEKALSSAFQVRSIPTLLFIPLKGKPMIQTGAMSELELKKIIEERLINEPKS